MGLLKRRQIVSLLILISIGFFFLGAMARASTSSRAGTLATGSLVGAWQVASGEAREVMGIDLSSKAQRSLVAASEYQLQESAPLAVSSGSNYYFVGAESYDPSVVSNLGVRGTIQVVSTPITGCLSFWVADEMSSNTVWGQVGYDICNGSTPRAFYEIFNGTVSVASGTTPVSTGFHEFSMYDQSGTTWAFALDGISFGSFDMGSSMSSASYPVESLSEEGSVSAPFNPPQVEFSSALQVLKSGTWYSSPNGYEPYGCGSTGLSCWGVQGNLQNASLPANSMILGGNTSPVAAGALLWNTAAPDFTVTASPTSLTVNASASGSSTITIAPVNGFTGTVTLAFLISPNTGLTCSLSATIITLGATQTSSLSCAGAAGYYTVTVTGTSGSTTHSTAVTISVTDFTISTSPASITIPAGSIATSTITITPVAGFTGTVSLASSVAPTTGLSCTLSPTSISLGSSQTSTLSCTGTTAGAFTTTVSGTSGSLAHSATVTVNVTDFNITANPTTVTVPLGAPGNSTITLSAMNGFTGTIILTTLVSPPTGLNCSLNPTSLTIPGTSTLSCIGSAGGAFNVTVTGTSGSVSHSVNVTFTLSTQPDFIVSAAPTSVVALASSTGTSNITVSPFNGFTGTVTLTLAVSPVGLNCGMNPTSLVLGAAQTSILSCTGSAGTYAITMTGASGTTSHSLTVTFTVQDFSLTASPTKLTIPPGATGNSTVTVTSLNGFSGTVTLSASVSPGTGLTCTLIPIAIPGGSGTSTLACNGSKGNYNVTVTGTSGSLTHSYTVEYHQAGKYLLEVMTSSSGVQVIIDGNIWTTDASGKVSVQVDEGTHTVLVQTTLPCSIGPVNLPGELATNTFSSWGDGNSSNPLTLQVVNDTVLTATYHIATQTSSYGIISGVMALFLIPGIAILYRRKKGKPQ